MSAGWWGFLLLLMVFKVPGSSFTDALVAIGLLTGVVYGTFAMWARLKERAEKRAAYTTLPRRYMELEQRDPYLGTRIRAAGDEYLEQSEFTAIVRHSRAMTRSASAGALPPGSVPFAAAPKDPGTPAPDRRRQPYWTPARWVALPLIAIGVSAWGGEQLTPTGTTWYSESASGWNPVMIVIMWVTGKVPIPRGSIAILCVFGALAAAVIYTRTRRRAGSRQH
ncbi:MAG: hypothetical protein HOQ07_03930 [Sinomonas sp.]|nr:hypothetical protein [Sinomonas sp.]